MVDIIVKNWGYIKRLNMIMDIIMGRLNVKATQADYQLTRSEIQSMIKEIIPIEKVNLANKIIIFKNADSVYLDHNDKAGRLGPERNNGNLRNNIDKDIAPEFADFYIQCDQETMNRKQTCIFTGEVFHKDLGVVEANATIHPIFNDNADCQGVLVVSSAKFSLEKQPFPIALNYLHKGLAHHMVQKNKYKITLSGVVQILYRREVECLLYLLIGLSAKTIAQYMQISPRTVDNTIAKLKEKFGVFTREALIAILIKENFLFKLK